MIKIIKSELKYNIIQEQKSKKNSIFAGQIIY